MDGGQSEEANCGPEERFTKRKNDYLLRIFERKMVDIGMAVEEVKERWSSQGDEEKLCPIVDLFRLLWLTSMFIHKKI